MGISLLCFANWSLLSASLFSPLLLMPQLLLLLLHLLLLSSVFLIYFYYVLGSRGCLPGAGGRGVFCGVCDCNLLSLLYMDMRQLVTEMLLLLLLRLVLLLPSSNSQAACGCGWCGMCGCESTGRAVVRFRMEVWWWWCWWGEKEKLNK